MSYPRAEPPDELLPDTFTYLPDRCEAQTPAWGWEADSERCRRPKHDDAWHYYGEQGLEIWWRIDDVAT